MKIYFGAAVTSTRKLLPLYKKIVAQIKKQGGQVVSEHVADHKLEVGEGLPAKELFRREAKKVEKVDLMVAEVTYPSWGTAFLLEHALKLKIPVLALYYKDNHVQLSPMIEGHPDLYVQSYDEDNLNTVIAFNLKHFALKMGCQGKLIVMDGTNGSGKATQTALLMQYFKKHKIPAKHIAYPRYYTSFHGKTVSRFLKGEFGKLNNVSPYLSSLAYALDRLTSKNQILGWLEGGNLVVADRYVTSSLAHQAVKLKGKEREKIINWIYDMEYKQHRMPRENIVIYLYVSPEISEKLIEHRGRKKDIEESLAYQRQVAKLYLKLCQQFRHWVKIDCVNKKGQLMSKKQIHDLVVQALQDRKILIK